MEKYAFFPCRTNEAVLVVTSYHNGQMHGWLTGSRLDNPTEIHSVPHLLFSLDEMILREDRLISFHAFAPSGLKDTQHIAVLRIRILFQENATWQGLLLWEDRQKEASFRSVWELIQILDEILAD